MQSSDDVKAQVATSRLSSDFWKYLVGQAISVIGSSISLFVLPLLIYQLTHSALDLAIATTITFLPYLLFGLILGAWVDRLNRKRLMIWIDVARALTIASIPALFMLHLLPLWWIYATMFISTTLSICFNAADFAVVPALVGSDDLVVANGRLQACFEGATIIGPLLAGGLIVFMPLTMLIYIDAGSFLISVVFLAFIRTSFNAGSEEEKSAPTTIWQDIGEGLRYVWSHPVLRSISLMMTLVNLVVITITAQLVLFAKQQLLASDSQIGLLFSAGSVGIVVFALLAGPLRKRWSFQVVALGSLMLNGLLLVVMAVIHWYWVALVIWALSSGAAVVFNINTASLRQAITPNQMLGRVMTIAQVLAWSAIPVGSLLGGAAIESTHNIALVFALIGVLVFLLPVAFAFTSLGHAEQYLPQKESA